MFESPRDKKFTMVVEKENWNSFDCDDDGDADIEYIACKISQAENRVQVASHCKSHADHASGNVCKSEK